MPKILYHKHLMINFKTFTGYHNVSSTNLQSMVHCFLLKFKSDIRSSTLNYKTKALVYPGFLELSCRSASSEFPSSVERSERLRLLQILHKRCEKTGRSFYDQNYFKITILKDGVLILM